MFFSLPETLVKNLVKHLGVGEPENLTQCQHKRSRIHRTRARTDRTLVLLHVSAFGGAPGANAHKQKDPGPVSPVSFAFVCLFGLLIYVVDGALSSVS